MYIVLALVCNTSFNVTDDDGANSDIFIMDYFEM